MVLGEQQQAALALRLLAGRLAAGGRRASPARRSGAGSTAAGSPTGSGTMSRIVVPVPGALSIVTSPPISTASRWQITSPRPVPPKRCVVDALGLRELLEQAPLLLVGHADAGVGDRELDGLRLARLVEHARRHLDAADLGELHRVGEEVAEDLAQPQRVADVRRGEALVGAPRQQQALRRRGVDERLHRRPRSAAQRRTSSATISSLPASIFEKSRMSPMICSSDWAELCAVADHLALLRASSSSGRAPRASRSRRSSASGSRGSSRPGTSTWRGSRARRSAAPRRRRARRARARRRRPRPRRPSR